ncbi:MAG: hypothetical protein MN733_03520 [Nitrososphaera sp.]|nr:hypothetical protein [Nitrososphaera sp.]
MVLLACRSDSNALSKEFICLANKIAMHIAAANPRWIRREDVPEDILAEEKQVMLGRINAFYAENVLMEQTFVQDASVTIGQIIDNYSAVSAEPIVIRRFARFEIGG